MIILAECSICYAPINVDTNQKKPIVCPGCGLPYKITYIPKLTPVFNNPLN